jgi:DNA-binding NtrC family response regulator
MATLLLIDDDQSLRAMLDMLFSNCHECHTADRAEQALVFLEAQSYDVVITDILMPGLSGIEILRRISQRHPATPVIVITGTDDQFKDQVLKMGAFAFFSKPFSPAMLNYAVSNALALLPSGSKG